jgi:CheY-like chemotaxis protein
LIHDSSYSRQHRYINIQNDSGTFRAAPLEIDLTNTLSAPMLDLVSPGARDEMNTSLNNKTILVVDDDPVICDSIRVALEEAGGKVILAHSVDSAFETYRQSPPHAVIADIRLGRSDGYALIKEIRKTDSEYRGFTPVIAITTSASPDDEARALAAGFNAFVAKPFDSQFIVAVVAQLLKSSNMPK